MISIKNYEFVDCRRGICKLLGCVLFSAMFLCVAQNPALAIPNRCTHEDGDQTYEYDECVSSKVHNHNCSSRTDGDNFYTYSDGPGEYEAVVYCDDGERVSCTGRFYAAASMDGAECDGRIMNSTCF